MSRILVIDDEELVRYALRLMLEMNGHVVEEAVNGKDGLEKQMAQGFDLLIVDLVMPIFGGLDVICWMQDHFPKVPVLAISGGARVRGIDLLDNALEAGAKGTLLKPFMPEDINDLVDRCLAKSLATA
jgi:DNA-binding NtrC family response regulator